jgi:hypothetical protein
MSNQWIFKGFETPLPVWLILILIAVSIGLSYWSYSSVNIKTGHKYSLIGLRSIGLILLLLVLINPVIQRIDKQRIKSQIAVLFDTSLSTDIKLGQYQGIDSYRKAIEVFSRIDTNFIELDHYSFDSNINPIQPDSIVLDGRDTDIAKALGTISELKRDVKAIVLVSDGQYTRGQDPRFVADRLSVPVFTIGLGDSTRTRDIFIQDIIHPEVSYKDSPFLIEVIVSHNGFKGATSKISLKQGNTVLETKQIEFLSDRSVQSVNFQVLPDNEGLQQFEISVDPLTDEWSKLNNQGRFAVEILDNKLRIMMLSFEVHPDIKVMQQMLDSDASITHRSITWIANERFINGPLPTNSDTLDLIILFGYPHPGIPPNIRNQVNNLLSQSSYVLSATPLFDPALAMSSLQGSIPLALPPINSPFEIGLRLNPSSKDHPILRFDQPDYDRAPRLYSHIRNINAVPGAEVLIKANFRGADLDSPVLVVRTIGSRRTAVLNLFGYYSWNLSTNPLLRNGIQELLRNLVVWTATKPDDRKLIISTTRKGYDSIDPIVINAFLKDESGLQVSDGIVNLDLKTENGQSTSYNLNNDGLGKYSLKLGSLPQGLYSYDAVAFRGSRELDRRSGQFAVSDNVVEYLNTQRNESLLKDIAHATGGAYYTWDESERLYNNLNASDFKKAEYRDVAFDWYPYRRIAWFLLALVLFTSEWVLRKYLALP